MISKKEKKVQNALGTMKSQMFVSADYKDTDALLEDFEKALENFGLFMYVDPYMDDTYSLIISNEKLTEQQTEKLFIWP